MSIDNAADQIPRHTLRLADDNITTTELVSAEEAEAIRAWLADKDKPLPAAAPVPPPVTRKTGPFGMAVPMIYEALIAVMREVSFVSKDGINTQQNYPFRGIDGVVNAVGPAMRKHGVFCLPLTSDLRYRDARTTADKPTREVTGTVTYRFFAGDGSYLDAVVPGESLDQSDKGTAKAMSVALRILLIQTFMIPTQEPTTDHDGHYLTRGGSPGLSKYEREMGLALLAVPTQEQRENAGRILMYQALVQALDFRTCLDEHDAWEAPATEGGATWGELLAHRVADEISRADTKAALNGLWTLLKTTGYDPDLEGKRMTSRIKERAAAIKARNAAILEDLSTRVVTGTDVTELERILLEEIPPAHAAEHITEEEAESLAVTLRERTEKLRRQAAQEAEAYAAAKDADNREE